MSNMEMFIGNFEIVRDTLPDDDDELYDMGVENKCHYVRVDGIMYKAWKILDVDEYGFTAILPPQDRPVLLCYWYNGGAGVNEVIESAIRSYLKGNVDEYID
jgi:hypothetical protein